MTRLPAPLVLSLILAVSSLAAKDTGRTRGSDEHSLDAPLVTAVASRDRVRFTALALARKIRLEVLSQTGEPLYDSGLQPGNRLSCKESFPQKNEQRLAGQGDGHLAANGKNCADHSATSATSAPRR